MSELNTNHFVDVILPLPLERNFTYAVTEAEAKFIKPGVRVAVPFGNSKIYTGIAYNIHHTAPTTYDVKSIHSILDESPIVTPNQFKFWEWISEYYMCSVGEVMNAALPNSFLLQSETSISLLPNVDIEDSSLTDEQFLVLEAFQNHSRLTLEEVQAIVGKKNTLSVLQPLLKSKILITSQNLIEKYKPKTQRCVRLLAPYNSEGGLEKLSQILQRAKKLHHIVVQYFALLPNSKDISVSVLKSKSGASSAQIKSLIDKKVFEDYEIEINRIDTDSSNDQKNDQKAVVLSDIQNAALDHINQSFDKFNVCLFHGVTSSGKTEIYVKLIKTFLKNNGQALFLVPEIALTSQLVGRLKQYFGNQVVVYHSRYSPSERVEIWNDLLNKSNGTAKVIIGARSSIFLPFSDLKLIIVDEEHEPSYKQFDPAPRYHARDAALVLGQKHNSKIVLGSATPSLESYYNALIKKIYAYVSLNQRYNNVVLPDIELVDLQEKYKRKKMTGHFSDRMILEIQTALEDNQQIILFQNRRGYAPVISCNTCGHTPDCVNCDVKLTYHQNSKQLRCHYCSYTLVMKQQCSACGGFELDFKGFGTEQIQEEVELLFPAAKVARMDLDTTRGKYSYDSLIQRFENRQIDILVGTQMLSKGLDFRHVKLVGVLNADQLINFPDFRSHERTFQVLQQVAGRSGRTAVRGKVIVQTFNPNHNIFQQVSSNSYQTMVEEQLYQRRIYKYPPYYRLIKITLKHKDYNNLNASADWFKGALSQIFGAMVLGPEFPPVSKVRNFYIKNILIKIPPEQSLKKTKKAIYKVKNSFWSAKIFRSVRVVVTVDHY